MPRKRGKWWWPTPRLAKRAASLGCFLIAAIWIWSAWWHLTWVFAPGRVIMVENTSVHVFLFHRESGEIFSPRFYYIGPYPFAASWAAHWSSGPPDILQVPFWLILTVVAIPTAWLWYLDRPQKAGCKKCGYSLTGLPAASPCPECGSSRLSG